MRSVSVLVLGLALCFFAGSAMGKILFIDEFPHFQTFDSWDLCYYDGTCYEQRCDSLSAGWYNPKFEFDATTGGVRHWWVIDEQTPTNWAYLSRDRVDCSSVKTGPCADHTSGEAKEGKFLYVESSACYGVTFEVRTPTFMFNNSGAQISFWYYMDGDTVGSSAELNLDLSIDNGTWVNVFQVKGPSKGPNWIYKNVEVADAIGNNATSANPTPVTFRFRALTTNAGDAFYSDIAIDDVYVTQDGSPNTSEPYIQPNDTKPPPVLPSPVGGKEDDDEGLPEEAIIGIVIGIVGACCCLCCLLCILFFALLFIISPRKPPEEQAASGGL